MCASFILCAVYTYIENGSNTLNLIIMKDLLRFVFSAAHKHSEDADELVSMCVFVQPSLSGICVCLFVCVQSKRSNILSYLYLCKYFTFIYLLMWPHCFVFKILLNLTTNPRAVPSLIRILFKRYLYTNSTHTHASGKYVCDIVDNIILYMCTEENICSELCLSFWNRKSSRIFTLAIC